jgi:thiamine kinase-like enzyme
MSIDLTHQIHKYLTTAPSSLFAQQAVEMVDHWQGDANLLWRVRSGGQEAIVKLFLDAGQARSRRQYDAHVTFAPSGLAPLPLWADRYPQGLSRQLIVYQWCDGESLSSAEPGILQQWAEAIAQLHTTLPDEVGRFSPHPVNLDFYWRIEQDSLAQIDRWLASSGLAMVSLFRRIAAAADTLVRDNLILWQAARPTPVHGDLSLEHTLLERGRIQLLDWEMFGLGDPALDIARLLQREAQTLTAHQTEAWLAHYLYYADEPYLAQRIDVMRKLLELHNVNYLLLGLQQHATGAHSVELADAMPFIRTALAASLERAAHALWGEPAANAEAFSEEVVAWLLSQAKQPNAE